MGCWYRAGYMSQVQRMEKAIVKADRKSHQRGRGVQKGVLGVLYRKLSGGCGQCRPTPRLRTQQHLVQHAAPRNNRVAITC